MEEYDSGLKVDPAVSEHGELVHPRVANRDETYYCPACLTIVILKCGEIRRTHFAHKKDTGCSSESYQHAVSKLMIIKAVMDAVAGKGPWPSIHRKCPVCGAKWTENLSAEIRFAGKERKTSDGSQVDVLLFNAAGEPVFAVELFWTHEVSEEKLDRLEVPFLELLVEDVIEDPLNWYPVQDTLPRPCCENCRRIEQEKIRHEIEIADRVRRRREEEAQRERQREERERVERERVEQRRAAARKDLSLDQKDAVDEILNGPVRLFMLTGPAGSGKSFVIDYLKGPGVFVCAATASAASLIGGRTLHSYLGLVPLKNKKPNDPNYILADSDKVRTQIKNTKLLIVDECSMISEEVLEYIKIRWDSCGVKPRLVFVGDFGQLPPVSTPDHPARPLYESRFWGQFKVLELTTIHRQKEKLFVEMLRALRVGDDNPLVRAMIESRRVQPGQFPKDCPYICAINKEANAVNDQRLSELKTKEYPFRWKEHYQPWIFGKERMSELRDKAIKECRYRRYIRLKVGARVCLLNNDSLHRWFNGSMGTLVGIAFSPEALEVKLDGGNTVYVRQVEEEIYDDYGSLALIIEQYPVMLGWAMTIHKAQGRTLERAVVSLDNHFDYGMTYTALSRLKSLSGLFITGTLKKPKVNPKAIAASSKAAFWKPLALGSADRSTRGTPAPLPYEPEKPDPSALPQGACASSGPPS